MRLDQRELLARLVDAGLLIGALRGGACRGEITAVPEIVLRLLAVGHGELQRLHRDEIALAEAPRDLGRGDDGGGGAVADAAAIEEAERLSHHRRLQHGVVGDLVLQMRLRIAAAIVVALHRDMRHRLLEVVARHAVLGAVGGGELGEAAGRRDIGPEHRIERAAPALRQPAIAGVLELFDAERQRDVAGAGGNGVGRAAERLGTRGAIVLDAGHRDVRQPERHGERHARLAYMLLLDRGREPCRVDLAGLDAGVLRRLLIGLDDEVVGVAIPALAELRAAHAEDRDLVPDALGHRQTSFASPAGDAFQKYLVKPRCGSTSLMRNTMRMGMPTSTLPTSTSVKSTIMRPPSANCTMP